MAKRRSVRLSGDFQLRVPNRALVDPLLDGEKLFTIRYRNRLESSTGVERLALYWMGRDVMRSVTLTLDVFSPFEKGYVRISPVKRKRQRLIASGIGPRFAKGTSVLRSESRGTTPLACFAGFDTNIVRSNSVGSTGVNAFDYFAETSDTTASTRPYGSDFGEYVHKDVNCFSPGPSVASTSTQDNSADWDGICPYSQFSRSRTVRTSSVTGAFGRIPSSVLRPFLDVEEASTRQFMASKAVSIIPTLGFGARRYTLFRNVVELKDLHFSIEQMKSTLRDLNAVYQSMRSGPRELVFSLTRASKDIPKEYVGYHFGWKQLYRDIYDLLNLPEKLAKEVNYLLTRSGKPTTYRRTVKFIGPTTTSPSFSDYIISSLFTRTPTMSTSVFRECEVKVVVNTTFDFPPVGVPALRNALLLRKTGVLPTVSDLYDLVPWSWLVDWFSGLGDYVHAMDYINTDPSLINYGFCTGITRFSIQTTFDSQLTDTWSVSSAGKFSASGTIQNRFRHTSVADGRVQVRMNLASLSGVHTTSDVDSLSPYQQSILGALLLQRTPAARR